MAREPLKPVYLIHGGDQPKVELAMRRMRQRAHEEGGELETLHAAADPEAGADPDLVAGLCNSLGLFGGPRLIFVSGVEAWFPVGRDGKPASDTPDLGLLLEYLKDPAPDTTIFLFAHEQLAVSALTKAVEKAGVVLVFALPERRELNSWLAKQADDRGLRFAEGALGRLREICDDDALAIAGEMDKLVLYAGDEPATVEDVELVCVYEAEEVRPWGLTDPLGAGDLATTLLVLGEFLDRRDWEVARAIPVLAGHLHQLARARTLVDQGAGSKVVAEKLGMRSEFPARKLCSQTANWPPERTSRALARMAQAEAETRGDSVLPDRFALERALVEAMAD